MRASVFSAFLLGIITVSIPWFALADDAPIGSADSQFEPTSYVTPPLFQFQKTKNRRQKTDRTVKHVRDKQSTMPRNSTSQKHKVQPKDRVLLKSKPLPLEVKRLRAKMQGHAVVKHHPPLHHHAYLCHKHHHKHLPVPKHNVLFTSLKYHHHLSHCIVYPGSLKSNVQRIAAAYGWHRMVWTLPEDYRWVGKTRITAQGLPGILGKLLKGYPLQAEFYKGNHVLVIIPRTFQ